LVVEPLQSTAADQILKSEQVDMLMKYFFGALYRASCANNEGSYES
jgi:hypothetical protein